MKIDYINFKDYANNKLHMMKEEKTSTYEKFVMNNFGKLNESLTTERLHEIGNNSKIFTGTVNIAKKAIYKDKKYPYFIYDKTFCMGIDESGKIIYIEHFNPSELSFGLNENYSESDLQKLQKKYIVLRNSAESGSKEQEEYNKILDTIYNQLHNMK